MLVLIMIFQAVPLIVVENGTEWTAVCLKPTKSFRHESGTKEMRESLTTEVTEVV